MRVQRTRMMKIMFNFLMYYGYERNQTFEGE